MHERIRVFVHAVLTAHYLASVLLQPSFSSRHFLLVLLCVCLHLAHRPRADVRRDGFPRTVWEELDGVEEAVVLLLRPKSSVAGRRHTVIESRSVSSVCLFLFSLAV
ncbi:hypothetical protein PINS_up006978 [Pythium insidiosum]|nr:hypothetical protein PINS_up006978 [Pythium insidiosum]